VPDPVTPKAGVALIGWAALTVTIVIAATSILPPLLSALGMVGGVVVALRCMKVDSDRRHAEYDARARVKGVDRGRHGRALDAMQRMHDKG